MLRDRRKRLYDLHSWTGVIIGLFVFVVCFSGITALFRYPLYQWEDPAYHRVLQSAPQAINAIAVKRISELDEANRLTFIGVAFPSTEEPFLQTRIGVMNDASGERAFHLEKWDIETGAEIPARGHGVAHWLFSFHTRLMLSGPIGGYIVGSAGLLLLLSVVTGLLTHWKMAREAFTWRLDKSTRLKWQDSHKVMGLWLAPFHAMIALTGVVVGLFGVFAIGYGVLVAEGGSPSVRADLAAASGISAPAGTPADMMGFDRIYAIAKSETGIAPRFVNAYAYGDENALFRVYFEPDTALSLYGNVDIAGASGDVLRVSNTMQDSSGGVAYNVSTALHYGSYGGLLLLVLYALMGAALCIVIATGMMMWVERRRHGVEGKRPAWVYDGLSRVIIGLCAGQVLASAVVLLIDPLVGVSPTYRIAVIGWAFFVVWGGAFLYPFLRRQDYGATRELLAASGLCFAAVPIASAIGHGIGTLNPINPATETPAIINWGFAVTGSVMIFVAGHLPTRRSVPDRRRAARSITVPSG